MMPALTLYLLLVSGLLAGVALAAEKALAGLRIARRNLWFAVLLMSAVWPLASVLSVPQLGEEHIEATPRVQQELSDAGALASRTEDSGIGDEAFGKSDWRVWTLLSRMQTPQSAMGAATNSLDPILTGAWIASSISVLLFYSFSAARLAAAARRWRRTRLDDIEVLVSDRFGPAMFGLLRPRIVVPEWLLRSPQGIRGFVLRHECEHITGRDHWILAAALMLLAAMPWNPVLWWQLRQLRFAIETDCDLRVLRGGSDPVAYAKALLTVGEHRSVSPLASMALTTPPSRL
jgi:hypothetical protein